MRSAINYVVENPWSYSLGEEENLLISNMDSDEEVIPFEDGYAPCTATISLVDSANPSIELKGLM